MTSWNLRPADEGRVALLARNLGLKAATARCLVARGLGELDAARAFVEPRLKSLRAPVGLAGLPAAVARLVQAIERNERIGVFGDYDVDGVTTTAVLTSFLRGVGATVVARVAHRDGGYGFSEGAAVELIEAGCTLIITGDCGTSDLASVLLGTARGVDTVVLDHHTVPSGDTAHPAHALVNPYCADSTFPFRGLASVGLAFYVCATLRTHLRDAGRFNHHPEPDLKLLLDLVALGTVADLVPLTDENRVLTGLGLRAITARTRPGIAALLRAAGVEPDAPVDAKTIAWKLAPRLNAPGRLGAAEPSLALLLADAATAMHHAAAIEDANTARRELQDHVFRDADAQVAAQAEGAGLGAAIVVAGRGWAPGVVGIVAAKLVDKYRRPAFVIAVDPASGVGRGSARTLGPVNLYACLSASAGHLDRFGGHAAAAGFSMRETSVDALREQLCELARGSGPVAAASISVDAEVRLADVDERLVRELGSLGPFGQAHEAPTLMTSSVKVLEARRVGDGTHLKLTLVDGDDTRRGGIGFGLGASEVMTGDRVDVVYGPMLSRWQGRSRVELELRAVAIQRAPE